MLPSPAPQPQASPSPVYAPPADEISLRDLFDIVLGGKWIIAGVTFLATTFGVAYALLTTPIYEAEALVQIEDQRGGVPGFEELTLAFGGTTLAEAEIEILRSRLVLGEVVDRMNLEIVVRPERFPALGAYFARRHAGTSPAPPRFGASRYAWGGERLQVDRLDVAPQLTGQAFALVAGADGHFTLRDAAGATLLDGPVGEAHEVTSVNPGKRILEIFVSDLEARPGTQFQVARRSRLRAIEDLRGRLRIQERGRGTGILQLTLQGEDPVWLKEILDGLANTYLRQHVERRSAEAQQSLSFLEKHLPELRAELETAEERFNAFRREHKAVDLSADTQHLLSQIVQVESELARLELQHVEEAQRFAAQHPRMQTLRQQRGRLQATKAELEARVDALPDRQQEALRLRREVDVATELYTSLLNTAQELRVVQAGTVGNIRILDYAEIPERPVKPRRSMIAVLSMMLGLMLGMGLVFVRQALQRTVQNPDALENELGLPVYTVIPHSREEERASKAARRKKGTTPLLARDYPQDPAIEGLRSFRTSLHFALLRSKKNVIAITSPQAESGKSFVCINAGHVFAEAGKKVLVIDADMRRGYLHGYLGRGRAPGLSEVLTGQAEAMEAIHALEGSNLEVMPTGTLPPNPSELLMGDALGRLLDELGQTYDLVIVDTPPMLAVTDAAIVGAHAGAMFMLVRAGKSQLEEIEAAVKRLHHNDIQVAGILFNDLGAQKSGYGAYKYQYYYQYRYSSRD
jgi:tyrosine-protein kinase Etk/Wzc